MSGIDKGDFKNFCSESDRLHLKQSFKKTGFDAEGHRDKQTTAETGGWVLGVEVYRVRCGRTCLATRWRSQLLFL